METPSSLSAAFEVVTQDALTTVGQVALDALLVFGLVFVIRLGIKMFQRLTM